MRLYGKFWIVAMIIYLLIGIASGVQFPNIGITDLAIVIFVLIFASAIIALWMRAIIYFYDGGHLAYQILAVIIGGLIGTVITLGIRYGIEKVWPD